MGKCPFCGAEVDKTFGNGYVSYTCGNFEANGVIGREPDCYDRQIAQLQARVDLLECTCAQAYQMAGVVGAPEAALDNLSDAAQGKPLRHPDGFLPLVYEDFEMYREGQAELQECRERLEVWRKLRDYPCSLQDLDAEIYEELRPLGEL